MTTKPIEIIKDYEENLRYSTNPCLPVTIQREHLITLLTLARQALKDTPKRDILPKVYPNRKHKKRLTNWNIYRLKRPDNQGRTRICRTNSPHYEDIRKEARQQGATITVDGCIVYVTFKPCTRPHDNTKSELCNPQTSAESGSPRCLGCPENPRRHQETPGESNGQDQ